MSLAGPRASRQGGDTGRTGTGRERAEQCFAVWVGARDVPGAGKHTNSSQGCKSRRCPKNHQPEPLPFPGANSPRAGERTLWATPAPAPMASAPPESPMSPHSSGQNWAWSKSKIAFVLPRTIPCTPGPPCVPCCAGPAIEQPWGCPPSPVAHLPTPPTPGRLRPSSCDPMGSPNDRGQKNGFLLSPGPTGHTDLAAWTQGPRASSPLRLVPWGHPVPRGG